jgi:hypothetical protein
MFTSTMRAKARAFILTVGTTLALAAPAAHAGNALGCAVASKNEAASVGTSGSSPLPSQAARALQAVELREGAAGSLPVRTSCGVKKTTAAVAPSHYQVLRNSF